MARVIARTWGARRAKYIGVQRLAAQRANQITQLKLHIETRCTSFCVRKNNGWEMFLHTTRMFVTVSQLVMEIKLSASSSRNSKE